MAHRFVDWLHDAKLTAWQMLPLVPAGPGGSPYSSPSALASNTLLISIERLVQDGWLRHDEVDFHPTVANVDRVDFKEAEAIKRPLLEKAAHRYVEKHGADLVEQLAAGDWRAAHGAFVGIKANQGQRPWWTWPSELRDASILELAPLTWAPAIVEEAVFELALQALFDQQWSALREHAKNRGVALIGDVPIYVDRDSADVWAQQSSFQLDDDGTPKAIAGVPPDAFSDTGQLWGNPLYDWDVLRADGHAFWVRRMQRMLEQVDVVRIDHFRAFAAYWRVDYGATDARGGDWVDGPGRALFDDLKAALGDLPIIAEDLGIITPDVEALRDDVGLPGMKVLQFAFEGDPNHMYLPHQHVPNCVVYTGTHDNNTTRGWWDDAGDDVKDQVRRYLATDGGDIAYDMVRAALASVAHLAVFPMQDALSLDGGARMNIPGQAEGNWGWRVRADAFNPDVAGRWRSLVETYGRAP